MTNVSPIRKNAPFEYEQLLTPGEVARIFQVDPKSVARWAKAGLISSTRTVGGHRRFFESEVRALLAERKEDRRPR